MLRELTLFVIASAGFGIRFRRDTFGDAPPGYDLSFGTSLFTAIESMFVKVLVPRWLYALPIQRLRYIDLAYRQLKAYIHDMIRAEREGTRSAVDAGEDKVTSMEAADLFRRMVAANEEEAPGQRLSEDELVSNIYVSGASR
jgi:cytochrome P450